MNMSFQKSVLARSTDRRNFFRVQFWDESITFLDGDKVDADLLEEFVAKQSHPPAGQDSKMKRGRDDLSKNPHAAF